jgi:hypothetical protein
MHVTFVRGLKPCCELTVADDEGVRNRNPQLQPFTLQTMASP